MTTEAPRNKHIPIGLELSLGHVLVAAELQADQGDWIGFSGVSNLSPRRQVQSKDVVLLKAISRGYDIADLVTWMDTEQAQDYISYFYLHQNSPYVDHLDGFFPSVEDLRSTADKWNYGWMSVRAGDSYVLVRRNGAGRYVRGKDFESCAQVDYSDVEVDVPTPVTRRGWRGSGL